MTLNSLLSEAPASDGFAAEHNPAAAPLRVLLIAYHFPPSAASGAFRLLGFSRHLPKFGWQVAVVAPARIPWEPYDPALAERVPDSAIVCRVPYPTSLVSKPFRRLAPYAAWLASAWPACRGLVRTFRPHLVLTSGPPHCVHALGDRIQRRYGVTWFADFRDPWVTNGQPRAERSLKSRFLLRWERRVIERADAIVLNAPRACEIVQAGYPAQSQKMLTVTNGFDAEAFSAASPHPEGRKCRLLHAGELYAGRDPRPLLDALEDLAVQRPGVDDSLQVQFVGQVTAKYFGPGFELPEEVRRRGLDKMVALVGHLPYADILQAMCGADILLLIDSPGRRMGVPAKLYEYLGAGRPVLALAEADGDTAWVLRKSRAVYRLAPPDDVVRIRQALGELLELMKSNGRRQPASRCNEFSRENLAGRLAEAMRRSVNAKACADHARRAGERVRS